LVFFTLAACSEGTPIAGSEPPAMTDPEADLPPGLVQLTNSSVGITAPGINVNAGTSNFTIGSVMITGIGRTTLTDTFIFDAIGSASTTDVRGLRLWSGGQPLRHGDPIIIDDRRAIIDLKNCPIRLSPGQTANLLVKAHIFGGVNRYAQFSLANAKVVNARDLVGRPVPVTINTGSWPLNLSYVTIDHGSLQTRADDTFTTTRVKADGTSQKLASIMQAALGEAIRLSSVSVDLYFFSDKIQDTQVVDLIVTDTFNGAIAPPTATIKATNPRATYFINEIIPAETMTYKTISASFKPGTSGTLVACTTVKASRTLS
jgi:hypothetical protein